MASIYLDPDAKGVTKNHIKDFERGKYGPIWANHDPLLNLYDVEEDEEEEEQEGIS